jgi:hypothetical protein
MAGRWQSLERFPQTHCGNSFHRVFLSPGEYWEFYAPHRQGSLKTKLRFRLEPRGERGIAEGGGTLYSNEFDGSIYSAEFVAERGD